MNVRALTILAGTLAMTAAIAVLVLWLVGRSEDAGRHGATRFAAALVGGPVPAGAEGYVKGVRMQFGDVRQARVVDVRSVRVGSGKRARTYVVADVLVEAEKGPAVLELEFDDQSLLGASETITRLDERFPRDVRDDALTDAEFAALGKAFQRRGGRAASDVQLSGRFIALPDAVKTLPARVRELTTSSPALTEARRQMRCVQRAAGDVEKLAACAD